MNQTKLNRKRTASDGGDFAALIGLDWASQRHALCLYDCATGKREASTLEDTPEAIAHWARGLEPRFEGKKIALCLKKAHTASVRKFCYAHNCRRMGVSEKRRHSIASMIPLCRHPGPD